MPANTIYERSGEIMPSDIKYAYILGVFHPLSNQGALGGDTLQGYVLR
jgi:hypothetical protein